MERSTFRLSWYEYGLGAFAFAVGTPLGVALLLLPHNRDARPRIVGILVIAALMATFPPVFEAERRTRTGGGWQTLPPPHASEFRRLLIRHLALCASHAVIVAFLTTLHLTRELDLRVVFVVTGVLSAGLVFAGFRIKRHLREIWTQSGVCTAA